MYNIYKLIILIVSLITLNRNICTNTVGGSISRLCLVPWVTTLKVTVHNVLNSYSVLWFIYCVNLRSVTKWFSSSTDRGVKKRHLIVSIWEGGKFKWYRENHSPYLSHPHPLQDESRQMVWGLHLPQGSILHAIERQMRKDLLLLLQRSSSLPFSAWIPSSLAQTVWFQPGTLQPLSQTAQHSS